MAFSYLVRMFPGRIYTQAITDEAAMYTVLQLSCKLTRTRSMAPMLIVQYLKQGKPILYFKGLSFGYFSTNRLMRLTA